MQVQELVFNRTDIYVKISGYTGTIPYLVDPDNLAWGSNYAGSLVTGGKYDGYYWFSGVNNITDNKPLEIREGSTSGTKVADISLRYENVSYDV